MVIRIPAGGNLLLGRREGNCVVGGIAKESHMKRKPIVLVKLFGVTVFGVLLAWPPHTGAQAPPGPQTGSPPPGAQVPAAKPVEQAAPPPPRQTILGTWKLNRDESDAPRKRSDDDRGSDTGGYGGRRSGGGYPGGGYPGGGRGGMGGPRGESDEERQKMRELTTPPSKITLSMTGAEVDLMDDQDRKRAFMTDGRKLQKSKDANYQEIAAHWDGKSLVTDEKSPRGGKMSRRFELSEDGRQLYETLRVESSGRGNRSITMRFVYDIPVTTQARQ